MPWVKQMMYVIGCITMLTSLVACATSSPAIDTFCFVYKPVYHSRLDTEETKAQIDMNNAVWKERCQ